MQNYTNALKQADVKALKLFEIVADQMQQQFTLNSILYRIITGASVIILILSLVVLFFFPTTDMPLQVFGLIGIPVSLLMLVLLLLRNPVIQSRHLLETVLRLNVVFISFIRRVQQSNLLLQSMYYENDEVELDKIYLWIQEFQGIIDQTQEEINNATN
jgi:hypothetical protein